MYPQGVDEPKLLELIQEGESLAGIARRFDMDRANLSKWIEADILRSARVREARVMASLAWDEKAEQGIADAADPFELSKAKEMAHHYRWRASKIAPKQYGDKLQTEVTGNLKHDHTVGLSAETTELLASLKAGSGDTGNEAPVSD